MINQLNPRYKVLLLFLFSFLQYWSANGQFERTYGGTGNETYRGISATSDGGFLVTGESNGLPSMGGYDQWITKFDSQGNAQWVRSIGSSGNELGTTTRELPSGNLIVSGRTNGIGAGNQDCLLHKLDNNGSLIWTTTTGGNDNEYWRDFMITSDTQLALIGYTSSFSASNHDWVVCKLDTNGNPSWANYYNLPWDDFVYSIVELASGDFIVCGVLGTNGNDGSLLRLDGNGNIVWMNRYGGPQHDKFQDIIITSDSSLVVTGVASDGSNGWNYLLAKFDLSGNLIWGKEYVGSQLDEGLSVIELPDKGFLIGGLTESFGTGNIDASVVRTDSNGNHISSFAFGGAQDDHSLTYSSKMLLPWQGNFLLAGRTQSFGQGQTDLYLIGIDTSLSAASLCHATPFTPVVNNLNWTKVPISPTRFSFATPVPQTLSAVNISFTDTSICCQPVQASFSADSVCSGSPTSFTSNSVTNFGTRFYWDFDGDNIIDDSTASNTSFTYPAAGLYNASLILIDSCGGTDTAIVQVSVSTCPSGIINTYTTVSAIPACNQIVVDSTNGFSVGDKILVIQMKGASVNTSNTAAFGSILNYNEAGNHEFATISAISGNTLSLQFALLNSYDPSGRVQLVTVPQYTNLTVNSPISAQPWNGSTGGILAFDVSGTLTLNATLDLTGMGFRGAGRVNLGGGCSQTDYFYNNTSLNGAPKGEGIVELSANFARGRGAPASGGGGGNNHNSGGGGGSNGGAGGLGGNEYNGCAGIANGGRGGYGLNYGLSKIFLGGGGGAGHENNNNGTAGQNGGGMIIFRAGTLIGNGQILRVDGNNNFNVAGNDGSGGGGAGGTILMDVGNYVGILNLSADGGTGGNTNFSPICVGAGGGGGGGMILHSGGALPGNVISTTVNGIAGFHTSTGSSCFNNNYGATDGVPGSTLGGWSIPENINPIFTFDLGNDTALCAPDTLLLNAGPVGNQGGSYLWSTSDTTQTILADSTGLYWVEVTDSNGCSQRDSINLSLIQPPQPLLGNDTSLCAGGTYLAICGGFQPSWTVNWNNGATGSTAQYTVPAVITVEATDTLGCTGYDTLIVSVIASPTLNLGNDTILCSGDSLQLDAGNPGASYLWSSGDTIQTVFGSAPSVIWVEVTDSANGCSSRDTIVLNPAPLPNPNLGNDTTLCASDSIILNPGPGGSQGGSYLWSTSASTQTIQTDSAGLYWVEVTDSNGCSQQDSINISISQLPQPILGNDTSLCAGDTYFAFCGGVFPTSVIFWNNGATGTSTQYIVPAIITVGATDTLGCTGYDTLSVSAISLPIVSLGSDTSLCLDDTLLLDAGHPGASYLWSTGDSLQTLPGTAPGTYWVDVTDSSGCTGRDTIVLSTAPFPNVNLGNDSTFCVGESVTLDAGNPGSSYLWSDNSSNQTLTVTGVGTVWVEVTNALGCSSRDSIQLSVAGYPLVNLGPDTTLCAGDSLFINGQNPGGTYLWSNGATTPTQTVGGTGIIWLEVTNSFNCSARDSLQLTTVIRPQINLGPDQVLCNGDPVTLDAGNPGLNYLWSGNQTSQTITVSTTGTYWVEVSYLFGCSARDSIELSYISAPLVNLGPDTTLCSGTSYGLDADPLGQYPNAGFSWNSGQTTPAILVSNEDTYIVTVSLGAACLSRDTITVDFGELPMVELGPDTSICDDAELILQADPQNRYPNADFTWNTGQLSPAIIVTATNLYRVSVSNKCGSTLDSIFVEILGQAAGPFIPNAFSPNNDGLNDEFLPVVTRTESYQLSIFDRWGKLVFETTNPNQGWDGTFNGNPMPEAVYVYRLRADDCRGEIQDRGGTITLIR